MFTFRPFLRLNEKRLGLALLSAASLAFVAYTAHLILVHPGRYIFEDMFITWRYSYNVAHGHGLVWNHDTPPVEGATTLLWVLLMAMPMALGFDALYSSHWLATGLTVATAWLAVYCLRRVFKLGWLLSAVGSVLIFLLPNTVENMLSGMETVLFAFLTLLTFTAFSLFYDSDRLIYLKFGAMAGILSGLARPDGILFLIIYALMAILTTRQRQRALQALALFALLPGLAFLLWKLWYFGALLPLPFSLKVNHRFWTLPGRDYIVGAVTQTGVLWLMALAAAGMAARWRHRASNALWLSVASIVFFYSLTTPFSGTHYRYFYTALVLICLATVVGLDGIRHAVAAIGAGYSRAVVAGILAVLVWAIGPYHLASLQQRTPDRFPVSLIEYRNLGLALSAVPNAQQYSLAYGDAGTIAFYSLPFGFIDMVGLNDRFVAGHLDDTDALVAYLYQRQPDLIGLYVFPTTGGGYRWGADLGLASRAGTEALMRDPRFAAYELLGLLRSDTYQQTFGYWMAIYLRSDSPAAGDLTAALTPLLQSASHIPPP